MQSSVLISKLAGTQPVSRMVVDDQQVKDIISLMVVKHKKTAGDYDKIYQQFEGGDIYDICKRIWKFCRQNFNYVIEDEKEQYVSSPITMLTNGDVDCKNYSMFVAGILDAMKRHGYPLTWQFRFVTYRWLQEPGHVFVVVNQNTDDIWVDPVLAVFNYHLYYSRAIRRTPKTARAISGLPGWIGSPESDLLSALKEYSDGITNAVQIAQKNNVLNTISALVLQTASAAIPGVSQALALEKQGALVISNTFGPGSLAARLANDLMGGNNIFTGFISAINDVFNGRTYQTDNYWGAVYYQFYVLGRNTTQETQVADGDVIPGLKWFIDRLGIFISGREHIIAIAQSPAAYLAYAKVNTDTTTDPVRVQAAYLVASKYFIGPPGNFDQSLRGAWKNTVGVFDQTIIDIANATGESVIQVANQQGGPDAAASQYIQQSNEFLTGIPNWLLFGGLGLLAYVIIED